MGRRGEDKEKKKIRDRRYDAELKKAFHHLRQVVPRVQRNSTRILQEAVKYIGILEKKVVDAGLWSTLQPLEAQRNAQFQGVTEETSTAKENNEILMDNLLSSVSHDDPDICSNLGVRTLTEEECCENPQEETSTVLTSPLILISSMSQPTEKGTYSFVSPEEAALSVDPVDTNEVSITESEFPLSVPLQQIHFLNTDQNDETSVLAFQSPDQLSSQELHTRLIPVVEVPAFTDDSVFPGKSHEVQTSPQHDSFLSAVTTISQEGLSDLGVTLSPLLSPLGILFSPGGDRRQDPAIAFLVESKEDTDADFAISSSSIDPTSNDVMSSICSDMTSIAASVEVTTAQMGKSALRSSKIRKSPRSSSIQIVPSISPKLAVQSKRSSPRYRDRRVLQDQSNYEEANSPLIASGRGRRRNSNNRSPELASFDHTDENLCFAMDHSRTPPSSVSGVLLTGKKKTSSRAREGTKRGRRI
ncbi:uncharacterized protein LOC111324277 isoform X2 [Stylophora pistillata]|uniref:uncharacterized protein LOC111324277 isoform X2 n=1 Tax=Stylophora pistillata TaxID=50429 RepID=UPI000C039CF2|nr:uncharacterized protein LOC111324277 isoform X2 [Stylophora pistillata]